MSQSQQFLAACMMMASCRLVLISIAVLPSAAQADPDLEQDMCPEQLDGSCANGLEVNMLQQNLQLVDKGRINVAVGSHAPHRSEVSSGEPSLEDFLEKELKGKQFTYVVNTGNAGDALIAQGTILLFDKIGLKYTIGEGDKTKYTNSTLVYAGAGNLVEQADGSGYVNCKQFLSVNAPAAKENRIILLPATIQGYPDLLRSLGSNVVIFTREKMSYEYVKSVVSNVVQVFLSQDMAFYIEDLEAGLPALKSHALSNLESKPVGFLLREDIEATNASLPEGNRDLSKEGMVVYLPSEELFKENVRSTTHHVMSAVGDYSEVWTNRLHVCIASSLVGVRVHCMDNSYGKNRAMYDFSIKGKYPNTTWHEHEAWEEYVIEVPRKKILDRSFARVICIIGIIIMCGTRLSAWLFQSEYLSNFIMLGDVLIWYTLTSVHLAASQELLTMSNGASMILVALVQVFSGINVFPFGAPSCVKDLCLRHFVILAVCGCGFFFASFFVLESLARSSVVFVQNIRACETFSTTSIMVLFGGQAFTGIQCLGIFLAVFGIWFSSTSQVKSANGLAPGESALLTVVMLMFANVLFSCRNVFMHQAFKSQFGPSARVTLFAVGCFMSLLAGACVLGIHQAFTPSPLTLSSLFPDLTLLVISCVAFVQYNLASFLVLMRVNPSLHSILLAGKRVCSVLLACALAHQMPTSFELIGMGIVLLGMIFFDSGKADKSPETSAKVEEQTPIKELIKSTPGMSTFGSGLVVVCTGIALWVCSSAEEALPK